MLVEHWEGELVGMKSLEHQTIANYRNVLENDRNSLFLIGNFNKDTFTYINPKTYEKSRRRINNYVRNLDPRVIILEDGRVFEDTSKENPSSPVADIQQFINKYFLGGEFNNRFNNLFDKHKYN